MEHVSSWPAAVLAVCGVVCSPAMMRRLAWIIILMIALVVVARVPIPVILELLHIS
jgi:hypothetical protein